MPDIHAPNPDSYRSNVGLVLFSKQGNVFLGRRVHGRGPWQWQLPQGGIDEGETPAEAAQRELEEEVGVTSKLTHIMYETEEWIYYDFPPDVKKRFGGPYIGQKQKWFAFSYLGADSDIRLDRHKPAEFDAWRWAPLETIPEIIVPFKRPVYETVAERFAPLVTQLRSSLK